MSSTREHDAGESVSSPPYRFCAARYDCRFRSFLVVDLASLLKQPEGKTLEIKRDLSSAKAVLRTSVARTHPAVCC